MRITYRNYASRFTASGNHGSLLVPQREALDERQVRNNAGGYVYQVTPEQQLEHFLILGSDTNTYYVNARKLTEQNAKNIIKLIKQDGVAVVDKAIEIYSSNRAPRVDPALFVLALAIKYGDEDTRRLVYDLVPQVRTGMHLFTLYQYVKSVGKGWSRGLRSAVIRWYSSRSPRDMAYQILKYQQREGMSHKYLLHGAHARLTGDRGVIQEWIEKGWPDVGESVHPDFGLRQIWAFERAKRASDVKEIVSLIRDHNLPREAVPTQFLTKAEVWEALLQHMPFGALVRNLGNMSKVGLLVPFSDASKLVVSRLIDNEYVKRSRMHPMAILSAQRVYKTGHGLRGSGTWTIVPQVVDALEEAFYAGFEAVEPTNRNIVLALDVSGSMGSPAPGVQGLSCREVCAVMAMVTVRTEPNYQVIAFSDSSRTRYGYGGRNTAEPFAVSKHESLDAVVNRMDNMPFGGTDCALPCLWAAQANKEYGIDTEGIVIYTDSETWAGEIHPPVAKSRLEKQLGHLVKQVVVGITSTSFTIADPLDANSLDVVGLDTSTPAFISNFIRGGEINVQKEDENY